VCPSPARRSHPAEAGDGDGRRHKKHKRERKEKRRERRDKASARAAHDSDSSGSDDDQADGKKGACVAGVGRTAAGLERLAAHVGARALTAVLWCGMCPAGRERRNAALAQQDLASRVAAAAELRSEMMRMWKGLLAAQTGDVMVRVCVGGGWLEPASAGCRLS
jgi:hypothetical protein